jgi:hypothetical protein
MGIQINGNTDTISAVDGSLTVSGADLGSASAGSLNVTGIVTASGFSGNVTGNINSSGISTVTDLRVGTAVTANSDGIQVGAGKSIRIFGSASGYSNLVASSAAGASELLLPSTGGTIDRLNRAGNILQVVQSHVGGKASTTSTSLTKLATSASITPSSASSKILIAISTGIGNADTGNANFSIVRTVGGSDTTVFSNVANKQGAAAAYQYDAFSWIDLDSPSTTSAVTYSLAGIRVDGNATPFAGGRNTDSFYAMGVMFILQEVAA